MSKVKRSIYLKDFYKLYKIRMKEKGLKAKSISEHKNIIITMGDVMTDIILERGIIRLPWQNGEVFLKKEKNEFVDYSLSVKAASRVIGFNDHTDGYIYKACWISPSQLNKKRKMWSFSMFRGAKRKLSCILKSKSVEYPDYNMMIQTKHKK